MSAKQGRTPRRPELSQHFLRSEALASWLAAQTHVSRHDLVVEIGPGRGALTAALARRCRKLIAVELDSRLCGLLREQFKDQRHVSIVQGDFLRFGLPTAPYKVVG
ncbi:MAG: rRNA adenine N-6-methyltransferase family protein, partial [Dehalococcoidia bacterium]